METGESLVEQVNSAMGGILSLIVTVAVVTLAGNWLEKRISSFRYRRHVQRQEKKHSEKLKESRAVIRKYETRDERAVLALFREYAASVKLEFNENWLQETLRNTNLSEFLTVAQLEERIVGYVICQVQLYGGFRVAAQLTDLYVQPEFRRGGIGSQLVAEVTREARSFGHDFVKVAVGSAEQESIRFFDMIGALPSPALHFVLVTPSADDANASLETTDKTSEALDPVPPSSTLH